MNLDSGYSLPSDLKQDVYSFRKIKILYGIYLFLLDHLLIWVPTFFVFFCVFLCGYALANNPALLVDIH